MLLREAILDSPEVQLHHFGWKPLADYPHRCALRGGESCTEKARKELGKLPLKVECSRSASGLGAKVLGVGGGQCGL